jgi:RNA polymerase sigma-70 factor, ECF subfamily
MRVSALNRGEEKRLIKSAQKGDADAFAVLYQANVQKIFRYVTYRVNNAQVAEDLTGDVFMRALEGLGKYTDRGRPFIAWLYRIAHARVVDFYRKNKRRATEETLENAVVSVQPDMDSGLVRQQAAHHLRKAIAALTADQQQVIILRFVEGLSLNETAQIMGKKANAIKALQHRAIRSLAGRLERAGFDIEEILSGLS